MKKKQSWVIVVIVAVALAVLGVGAVVLFGQLKITATPSEGQVVELLEGDVLEVASNYVQGMTDKYVDGSDKYQPKAVKLTWECKKPATGFVVKLGMKPDLSDAKVYETTQSFLEVSDLYRAATYYYQVVADCGGKKVESEVFEFVTADLPRTILVDGVSNTRDIGGFKTEDGKYRVKQGMVYRGAALDGISSTAKEQLLSVYGVRTDLDLRGELDASPLGDSVNFINVSGPYYAARGGESGIHKQAYREALLTEIRSFADEENYPIYMHCQIGRDRTGTLAFLINSLLGVGEKDLYLDYELSFLSRTGSSGYDGGNMPSRMLSEQFDTLIFYIEHSTPEGTWAEKTEAALLKFGVTEEEIHAIRSILLEEIR